ncbi:M23 family metallopeptidase [Pseudonocardia sp. RS11V-5]|uniref:M23 family metallopeptidase n=1 Tax=Pseudonocardia terrae TaxID=2905831 RepID=UPI001E3E5C98|nr:M23 family metallopeptidase [Pseudonocardia terrae]MCE3551882.1 M23 family metallopeptidase [Pseudonocardia terrae]
MARHRSPQGRRAIAGPPLLAVPRATAGPGGLRTSIPLPGGSPSLSLSSPPSGVTSLQARMAAVVAVGGVVAAAGQAAYSGALPDLDSGANALRAGLVELTTRASALTGDLRDTSADTSADTATGTADAIADLGGRQVRVPLAPVAVPPAVATPGTVAGPVTGADVVADVVKAAGLHQAAADAARKAAEEAEVARQAAEAEAARQADELAKLGASRAAGGGIQMVVGRVSSGFGIRGGVPHQGLDIAAPIGTPIHVPLAGIVISSGPASGFGLWVRVQHADGTITTYGHINRSLVGVGQQVDAGQEIAEVGNRGESTGPHLHIEVTTPAGTKINPKPWLDEQGIGYT